MLSLMYVQSLFQFGAKVGKWEGYYGDKNYLDMFFAAERCCSALLIHWHTWLNHFVWKETASSQINYWQWKSGIPHSLLWIHFRRKPLFCEVKKLSCWSEAGSIDLAWDIILWQLKKIESIFTLLLWFVFFPGSIFKAISCTTGCFYQSIIKAGHGPLRSQATSPPPLPEGRKLWKNTPTSCPRPSTPAKPSPHSEWQEKVSPTHRIQDSRRAHPRLHPPKGQQPDPKMIPCQP